jgi:hypothetical protein
MKTIKLVVALIFGSSLQLLGQDQIDKICNIYMDEIKPYLQEISKNESKDKTDNLSKAVINARYSALLAKTSEVDPIVREKMKDSPIGTADKVVIMKVVNHCYKEIFPGLDPSFFQKTHEKVLKL